MFPERRDFSLYSAIGLTALVTTSIGIALALFSLIRHRIRQMVLWHIPGPSCPSFLAGNFLQFFDPVSGIKYREHIWEKYGNVSRIHGALGDQTLLISDTTALTSILFKDRDAFDQPDWFIEVFLRAVGPGLLPSTGALHRKQRKLLNPIFSVPRLRTTVPLLHKITSQLTEILHAKVVDGPQEVEVVEYFSSVAIEMIAQSGLGHTFGSFAPDAPKNDVKIAIKQFMPVLGKLQIFLPFFPLVSKLPAKLLRFGAACLPLAALHYIIELSDTIHGCVERLFQTKKELIARGDAGLADQISEGKDVISALMVDNFDAPDDCKMDENEIKAQMITMLAAATDTTSITLARLTQVLSQHEDVQERLRQELNAAVESSGGELGYDELIELPYLDAVCRETLRLYTPVTFVSRTCRADTTVPLSHPILGVTPPQSSLVVPRGTIVLIDILGVNCDQNIWGSDANVWKPERWLAPLPDSVADAQIPGVYSNMMTFLSGGRACIGFKLAELELKIVMSQLIRSFRFLPSKTEVVWRLGPVSTPSVKGSNSAASLMPLVLERV
ncbi:cytochrome P450 [Artomyces pyxidatus]|uniref:Cytochrome P450 n=1 Tax=Artomyces pyxidatus TaxID=48021 RepID=A0ACB8SKF9_9AGAM|nr:cytochrome P450 [Artomyces pyxidatus]